MEPNTNTSNDKPVIQGEYAEVRQEQLTTFKPASIRQPQGRQAGNEHLKPISMKDFIVDHECTKLLTKKPWLASVKLVSNPYMYKTLGRANYATKTVELSDRLFKEPMAVQREVFIRAICHFIAESEFDERGDGNGYNSYVEYFLQRSKIRNYTSKGQSNSTGNVPANVLETQH